MLNVQPNTGGKKRHHRDKPYENHETWSELSSFQLNRLYKPSSSDEASDSGVSESGDDDNYENYDSNHATSHATPSDVPLPGTGETADPGAEIERNLSRKDEPATKAKTSSGPSTNAADIWPKLMVLGCGQFEGWNSNDC